VLLLFNKCTFYKVLTKKTKILFLGDINSIHLQKWIDSLKDDFELHVISLDPLENKEYDIEGVAIYTNETKTVNSGSKLSYLKSLRRFRDIHKKINPDFVHAHYASSYGLIAAILKPRRLFISVWGSDVYEFPKRSFLHKTVFKWILRKATQLFSTSHDMKRELQNYTKKEITVVPFGVDTSVFQPVEKIGNNQNFTVGTVKSLEDVYGIDKLIDAFASLKQECPNSRLLIYGQGSKEEELKKQAENLDVADVVEFRGFLKNTEVPAAIGEMDVFCALSRQESFGVSVVEASACGVPIIASNVGGLPEVVKDTQTGYLVENIEEAAEKLIFLAKNDILRKELGENARNFALEQYDWKKNVKAMKSFYTL